MKDWKDEIIDSASALESVHPDKEVFQKILHKIHSDQQTKPATNHWIAIAATVSFVVICNFLVIANTADHKIAEENAFGELMTDYNLYSYEN